jgi:transcriptional regulator GlxA family with amidase domain
MIRSTFLRTSGLIAFALGALAENVRADSVGDMMGDRKFRKTVGVLLGRYSVLLDWAGPAEVFYSSGFDGNSDTDEFRIVTIGKASGSIPLQVLGNYTPQFSVSNAPRCNVVIIPGSFPKDLGRDPATIAWVKSQLAGGAIILTVCTGALVAAEMGILDGRRVTTSHGALKMLSKHASNAEVVTDALFVDSGNIVTAAGTSTGIDAALHIVERMLGAKSAADEREYLEYKWSAVSG